MRQKILPNFKCQQKKKKSSNKVWGGRLLCAHRVSVGVEYFATYHTGYF